MGREYDIDEAGRCIIDGQRGVHWRIEECISNHQVPEVVLSQLFFRCALPFGAVQQSTAC